MKQKRGFSYIEALIIMVIVGLGLVPLVDLWITSFRMNQSGYQYLQANLAAQEILSNLKNSHPSLIHNTALHGKKLAAADIRYSFSEEFNRFKPDSEIEITYGDFDDIYQIRINIIWHEKNRRINSENYYLLGFDYDKYLRIGDL